MRNPSSNAAGRFIYACAALAGGLPFAVVLAGVAIEAPGLWQEGFTAWISDAGMRLIFGACVAALCAAPYILVARASHIAGPPVVFASAAALMITFQLCLTVHALLFNESSTAGLALMFMPVYLSIPAVLVWLAALTAGKFRAG